MIATGNHCCFKYAARSTTLKGSLFGESGFQQQPVVLERLHLAVDPAQGVHEQRGAQQIDPA